jgi:polysaccharide biosynthesis transport protein
MNPKLILLVVFAHRYIAAAVFVLVLLGGTLKILSTPKTFVASTDLLVDARVDPIAGAAAIGSYNYMATQVAIIQSDRLAGDVVKRLRIPETPSLVDEWRAATLGRIPIENYFGDRLRKGLQAEPWKGGNILRLTYEGGDPKFVAAVANAYAQAYLDLTVSLKVEPVRLYAEWFDERQKALRSNIETAQNKLADFQRENGIVDNDPRADVETQRLTALMAQLVAIQGDNMTINSRQKTSGGLLSPDIQASTVVQNLKGEINRAEARMSEMRVTLGPNHPQRVQLEGQLVELKQQLDQEMRLVSGSTNMAKTTGGFRESELRAAIAAQRERVISSREVRDTIAILAQDVEAAKTIYESVLQRGNQLNLEKQTDQTNVSVLSPAVEPIYAARPDKPKLLLMTIFGALAAALASAGAIEFLSRKVRVIEDIMIDDVPVLGVIERRGEKYSVQERLSLFIKFFTKRKKRKETVAMSRLAGLA